MATTQALLIENTIRDMKKAMTREDDASDSDSSITGHTNRGNKLKRKAKYVREGRLAQADGPRVYKKRILYNDYPRYIISRNPPRVDQDGDLVDSEHDNSDLDTTDAEDDPYRDVHVENILMPLTAAADLDKHPALAVPYTSQILEQVVQNVQDMAQREQAGLWRLKNIQTEFCGDDSHAPVSDFEAEEKMEEFEERPELNSAVESVVNDADKKAPPSFANWDTMTNVRLVAGLETAADASTPSHVQSIQDSLPNEERAGGDNEMAAPTPADERTVPTVDGSGSPQDGGDKNDRLNGANPEANDQGTGTTNALVKVDEDTVNARSAELGNSDTQGDDQTTIEPKQELSTTTSNDNDPGAAATTHQSVLAPGQTNSTTVNGDNISVQDYAMEDANAADGASINSDGPRRMATRAHTRANAPEANGQPTPPLSTSDDPASPRVPTTQIHPFFLPPPQSLPNSTAGLYQPQLADDARRLLSMYVQKQQEVARQSNELLTGLRKALRLKNTVWDWCRNEGHVGEMSDGEDWIDVEKWGIDADELRKGEEVEDEDPAGMVVKKTRNRRAAQ
ncbi:MAG: hypothetical protein Q9162_007597 [Coniocarpon cinnabarinum]